MKFGAVSGLIVADALTQFMKYSNSDNFIIILLSKTFSPPLSVIR